MKKQNENHLCSYEIKMIYNIKNMTIHTEWSVMRMIALLIYQKKRRNTFWKHQKTTKKKRNKMSNLKCWKSKNISSNRQIFREIWWQVEALEDETRRKKRNERKSESYIILMRTKSHLWFETDSMMTCINKKFRKASQIKKAEEKISSKIVTEYIKNINKSISINWAKFKK